MWLLCLCLCVCVLCQAHGSGDICFAALSAYPAADAIADCRQKQHDDDDEEERAYDSNSDDVKYKCGNWNFYSKQCPCCNRYVNNNKTHSHSQRQ